MEYKLIDTDGRVAATIGGTDMFQGTLGVVNPILWWPVGMSDRPGHMYTLKVKCQLIV